MSEKSFSLTPMCEEFSVALAFVVPKVALYVYNIQNKVEVAEEIALQSFIYCMLQQIKHSELGEKLCCQRCW